MSTLTALEAWDVASGYSSSEVTQTMGIFEAHRPVSTV